MGPAGVGTLPRVTLAVAALVAVCGELSSVDNCGIPGCRFVGGCRSSTEAECDFQGARSKINFSMESFPKSIRSITIVNLEKIEIKKNAIASYENVESIVLRNSSYAELSDGSLNRTSHSLPLSVTIENVNELVLYSNAIYGWKHSDRMSIKNVELCHIHWSAFSPKSKGGHVLFENITSLEVEEGAFKANLSSLTLKNISSKKCLYNTFGGYIGSFRLQLLEIKDIEEGCLMAKNWNALNVTHCRFPQIRKNAFQGTVDEVSIKTTSIGHVESEGISMNVSTLLIRESAFENLAEDALKVIASNSIILQQNNVSVLRTNAFRSLGTSLPEKPYNINDLFIAHAENGSFRFIEENNVAIHGLSFRLPCQCDSRWLAHQLVFGESITPQSIAVEAEPRLLQSLLNSQCSFKNGTLALREFLRSECSPDKSKPTKSPPVEEDADTPSSSDGLRGERPELESGNSANNASFPAIVATITLLVLMLTVVVAGIIWRRSRAGRVRSVKSLPSNVHRREEQLQCSRAPDGVVEQDYGYCEINVPNAADGETGAPFDRAAYSDVQTGSLAGLQDREEPTYEEIPMENVYGFERGMLKFEASDSSAQDNPDQNNADFCSGIPIYAVVVKKRPSEKNQGIGDAVSGSRGSPASDQVVRDTSSADISESSINRNAPEVLGGPVYATVSKTKCCDSTDDTSKHKQIHHQYDASSDALPVYAVISKRNKKQNSPETNPPNVECDKVPPLDPQLIKDKFVTDSNVNRRPEEPDNATAIYSVVVKDKCTNNTRIKRLQPDSETTCLATPDVPKVNRADKTSKPPEDPLYSEVEDIDSVSIYAEVSVDAKDDDKHHTGDDLLENRLYAALMS